LLSADVICTSAVFAGASVGGFFAAQGDGQPYLVKTPLSQRMSIRTGTKQPPMMPPTQPPSQLSTFKTKEELGGDGGGDVGGGDVGGGDRGGGDDGGGGCGGLGGNDGGVNGGGGLGGNDGGGASGGDDGLGICAIKAEVWPEALPVAVVTLAVELNAKEV
jgi:hypothetical protein